MKKRMKYLLVTILVFVLSFQGVNVSNGANQKVNVKIPSFDVKLNNVIIDNTNAKYPLIVYKDVTYFPLTSDYARALGVDLKWGKELRINSVHAEEEVKQTTGSNNSLTSTYKASLPTYDIYVNDVKIDQSKQPYPMLNFRDITYFPMSWDYVHNQFKLTLFFDQKKGLEIISYMPKLFDQIVYDDKEYFYLNSGGNTYYTKRSLDGPLIPLTDAQQEMLEVIYEKQNTNRYEGIREIPQDQLTERGNEIHWKDYQIYDLTNIKKELEERKIYGNEYIYKLRQLVINEHITFMFFEIYYGLEVAAPYTPRAYEMFILQDGLVTSRYENIEPYVETYVVENATWIYQRSNHDMQSNKGYYTNAALFKVEGSQVTDYNKELDEVNVEFVGVQDNLVYIRTYGDFILRDLYNIELDITSYDTYYYSNVWGETTKVKKAESGEPYLDRNGYLWVVPFGKLSKIKHVTKGHERIFWFYDVKE
ncbi:MAG: hypothetical protein CVU84_14355 [Firmicutes bacterium HGW-Firmicutes-1]|nr:MAG: hypothetical protein CVU84_14355 [Firmicutes bacterium HGW-Firmicutes-1]